MLSPATQETLLLGALASLIAALTVYAVTMATRPRLKISPYISKLERDGANAGTYAYRFKIINRSWRAVVDVRIRASLDKPRKVPGSSVPMHVLTKIPIMVSDPLVIPGRRLFKDTEARFARRVRVVGDLEALWPDDQAQSVRVRVTARDVFSGTFREIEHIFPTHECIQEGSFAFGKKLDVVPTYTSKRTHITSPIDA